MDENVLAVAIGQVVVSSAPRDVLVAYGLGSCVAVCLYDPVARVGGMLHALLPAATNGHAGLTGASRTPGVPGPPGGARHLSAQGRQATGVPGGTDGYPSKYVDEGVPRLLDAIQGQGGVRGRLVAVLCGGGQVLSGPGFNGKLNIGERNVLAAEGLLREMGLRIRAQDTGGQAGRTVKLFIVDGRLTVKTLGKGEKALFSP